MIDKSALINAINNPLNFVLYFEDTDFAKPHYYIILPTQKADEFIILTMITSQIQKRKNKYKTDEKALKSLIFVNENDLNFLVTSSVIDCNDPRKATINEILSKDKLKLQKGDIPKELIKNITKAINNSNRVRPNIKKQIDLSKI